MEGGPVTYYAVVDDFRTGMPQTVLAGGLQPRGIACHTTEGGEGEQGAIGTINYLISAASRNASYHEVWYPKGDGFEARRIVRPANASHSMNPSPTFWQPDARVRRILGDRWHDPNAYSYAVSIAGYTATTVPALIGNPGFIAGARRRIAEIRAAYPSLNADPMFNHGEGQADRSDWGPLMRPAILAVPAPAPETDVPFIEKYEEWTGAAGTPFWTDGPGSGPQKVLASTIPLTTVAQSVDGNWRIARYQDSLSAPRELLYFRRRPGLTPKVPGGDPLYDASVVAAIERRTPVPDCSQAQQSTADKANAQMSAWTANRPVIVP